MQKQTYDEAACYEYVDKANIDFNKKTVFMLGDSMRMGSCGYTKEYLKDIANVVYPEDNCRYTQYTYVNLAQWSNMLPDKNAVDVVIWNNGHWDIAHWDNSAESLNSIDTYCDMLVRIYKRLNTMFPNAKIIFSTTTPMNPSGIDWINGRTNEEIIAYNKAAINALSNFDILFYDAFGFLKDKPSSFFVDYCHLTEDGFDLFGKDIADFVRNII